MSQPRNKCPLNGITYLGHCKVKTCVFNVTELTGGQTDCLKKEVNSEELSYSQISALLERYGHSSVRLTKATEHLSSVAEDFHWARSIPQSGSCPACGFIKACSASNDSCVKRKAVAAKVLDSVRGLEAHQLWHAVSKERDKFLNPQLRQTLRRFLTMTTT